MPSLFDRALGAVGLARKSLANPSADLLALFGAVPTASGQAVTPTTALHSTAVAAATRLVKKSTAAGVLTRVLKRAAKPIEDAAKAAAPVDIGALRASISTKIVRGSAGKAAYAAAKRGGASNEDAADAAYSANKAAAGAGLSAVARVSATAPHSVLVEFGTIRAAAQPFLGPALRSEGDAALANIKTDIAAEVAATAKRVAARAAKKVKIA